MESLIGKFATIKPEKEIISDNMLSQIHGFPYEIINHLFKLEWICLKSHIKATYINEKGIVVNEDINRSFWIPVKDCIITDQR